MIDYIFWTGVKILKVSASSLGITYQELDVQFFIIFHPLLTLLFLLLWLRARRQHQMLKVTLRTAGILLCAFLALYFIFLNQDIDCTARLADQGYKFEKLSGYDGDKCIIEEPIKLYSTPTTTLTNPVTLSCSFAKAFDNWAVDVGAMTINHMGGCNCRKIAGSVFMSQHSYGNAIDISIIGGVNISSNWEEPAKKAYGHFTNILSPATNAAHHDHLHLDKGIGLLYWTKKFKAQVLAPFWRSSNNPNWPSNQSSCICTNAT